MSGESFFKMTDNFKDIFTHYFRDMVYLKIIELELQYVKIRFLNIEPHSSRKSVSACKEVAATVGKLVFLLYLFNSISASSAFVCDILENYLSHIIHL